MECKVVEDFTDFGDNYPTELWQALLQVADRSGSQLYLVGGTVRDYLLGRSSRDLDIAVSGSASTTARLLVDELCGGTIVDLCGPEDEAYRVVWQGEQIDFATYRANTTTIEEDLWLRDFSINALALRLPGSIGNGSHLKLVDPADGRADLLASRIRLCPGAFVADPVRMLRGFRLSATLGFQMTEETIEEVKKHFLLIRNVAAERIAHELALIFESGRTTETLQQMHKTGLLHSLLPEIYEGEGVEQPHFHHLDVLGHCFLTLEMMENILADPDNFFPGNGEKIAAYLEKPNVVRCLKWAALMHDIGKPATRKQRDDKGGRVTFYRHDEVGKELFKRFADRLKWSKMDTALTGGLISMHMHPFHLCNVQRDKKVTKRAALKLWSRAEENLIGLFLLAMSDSLASSGPQKPERMEEELLCLFENIQRIYDENIQPVLQGPRLVTGNDLIEKFGLIPGPRFSDILNELETARVEGVVSDRRSALVWIGQYLQNVQKLDPA